MYTRTVRVNVREARKNLSSLLNRIEAGEEVTITRNGTEVAKLVSPSKTAKVLPDLSDFRASIELEGEAMSETVVRMRQGNRY